MRRSICIQQKLEVVNYYNQLKAEKKKDEEKLTEPRPVGVTQAELKKIFQQKREARTRLKRNLEKMCQEKFPGVVKRCAISRWARKAAAEQWDQLPESVRKRASETNNTWKRQVQAPLKGRKQGGSVPWVLQKELDMLMVEASTGLSDVTERKEMVTVENVVPCLQGGWLIPWTYTMARTGTNR